MRLVHAGSVEDHDLSHDPGIRKRVLIEPGRVPGLTQMARCEIPAGRATSVHAHPDMIEVFYVDAGRGRAVIDDRVVDLARGSCLTVEPGERHILEAAPDGPMTLLYFGLAGSAAGRPTPAGG